MDKTGKRAACAECGKRRVIVSSNGDDWHVCRPCGELSILEAQAENESLAYAESSGAWEAPRDWNALDY